ncbi:sulfhydryl oxidase 2-like [Diorhabda sublineata]|uniref:sulfhydryl oxidase 2-like n=1 Tax=Diorhabda sublineata TaxID=1163346 RepID=UPI0024E0A964|nr:sulfhydryl oxidase 2-like [Diorhabda sublineata]
MRSSKYNLELHLLLLFSIQTTLCAVLRNRTNREPGLYSPEDDVEILTINNFNTSIYNSERAWLVEFYSNWCGYCKRAVPKVKAFGSDVKPWNDLVAVAVLDCANEDNAPVCEYFGITRYPTFRYIHEGYQEGPENTGLPIVADSQTNFTEHRKNLISILIQEQIENRGKHLPDLQRFRNSVISNVFKTINGTPELAFLIVQEPDDDVGPSVIMDFHKVKEIVIKYAFDNETKVINEELPALYLIQESGDLQYLNISSPDRRGIKMAISDLLLSKNIYFPYEILRNNNITESQPVTEGTTKEELEFLNKIKEAGDTVFQLDLENALRYSLKREIGNRKEIKGEQLEALKKYINVLEKYFPFGDKGKSLLRHLKEYINSSTIIDGHHIFHHIKDADMPGQNVFSGPEQWLGCKGSLPTFRGYPCGLWKLFHYLTINAAFDPTNTKDSDPKLVLEAMHGYIKSFFSCEDCSNHFQEMAKRRQIFSVASWEESVLWLWRAHNEVNKRLAGDPSEDPLNKKIQFPSKERCGQCYMPDGSWQEVEVLCYLKKVYGSENINYMGADPRISHLIHTKTHPESTVSGGYRILSPCMAPVIFSLLISTGFKL